MSNIKIELIKSVVLIACLTILNGCMHRKPINLTKAKERVEQYCESGKLCDERGKAINRALKHFKKVTVTDTAAVVFDVDDTVLSDYENEKTIAFGYIPKLSHAWILRADAPGIDQTKKLYDYLIDRGFHVIFLTGRHQDEYQATLKNLREEGFTIFDRVIVRSSNEKSLTAQEYKTERRRQLAAEGYSIVGTVGDQWSDLCGAYSGYRVKVPNYRYIIY